MKNGKYLVRYLTTAHKDIYKQQLESIAADKENQKKMITKYRIVGSVYRCGTAMFEVHKVDASGKSYYGLSHQIKHQIIDHSASWFGDLEYAGLVSKAGSDGLPLKISPDCDEPWYLIAATSKRKQIISQADMRDILNGLAYLITTSLEANELNLKCEASLNTYYSERNMMRISQMITIQDCVMLIQQQLSHSEQCYLVYEKSELDTYFLDTARGCQALTAAIPMLPDVHSPYENGGFFNGISNDVIAPVVSNSIFQSYNCGEINNEESDNENTIIPPIVLSNRF